MNDPAQDVNPSDEATVEQAGIGAAEEAAQREAELRKTRRARNRRRKRVNLFFQIWFILSVVLFSAQGWALATGRIALTEPKADEHAAMQHPTPSEGYTLPARLGDIGPRMVTAGAIDYNKFVALYQQTGKPMTQAQQDLLTKGSNEPIVITTQNSAFLLNVFWALGLANQNTILMAGEMVKNGAQNVVNFASTGGWTLAAKPIPELYASVQLVTLTPEQQNRVEEVSLAVYRPCCNNSTHFPDCNHGMAMLGLLELMASQGATVDQMFTAAKYVNAYWFPQQTSEVATLFKAEKNVDFAAADARELVSQQYMSGSGFQAVHQTLAQKGLLQQAPSQGGSCGVS